jgi:NADPH:quinone reductase-like Zn-dependent oxidoreductase
MKAVVLREKASDGPVAEQVAVVDDWPEPADPGPGELLVECEYSALNHMDLWVGLGIPGVDIEYPHVGGVEACGHVLAVGAGVDTGWIEQRILHNAAVAQPVPPRPADASNAHLAANYHLIGEHSPGTHRERYVVPAANAVALGDEDGAEAAAFGLTALTAYSMMCTKGQLRPGQRVLITGIGGGVATAALTIARWMGCEIWVSSRHAWKLERAHELGADHGILDEGQAWWKEVRATTDKRGVDMVVDTTGAALHSNCIRSLARGGAFVTAGATSGAQPDADLARLFWNQLRLLGSTMGTNDEFREVVSLFRAGHLQPVLDRVVDYTDAKSAWQRLEAGEQMGKLVLRWPAASGP